jgi:hypothetical protein
MATDVLSMKPQSAFLWMHYKCCNWCGKNVTLLTYGEKHNRSFKVMVQGPVLKAHPSYIHTYIYIYIYIWRGIYQNFLPRGNNNFPTAACNWQIFVVRNWLNMWKLFKQKLNLKNVNCLNSLVEVSQVNHIPKDNNINSHLLVKLYLTFLRTINTTFCGVRHHYENLEFHVMNLWVPWNAGNFLTSCKTIRFSRMIMPHEVKLETLGGQ